MKYLAVIAIIPLLLTSCGASALTVEEYISSSDNVTAAIQFEFNLLDGLLDISKGGLTGPGWEDSANQVITDIRAEVERGASLNAPEELAESDGYFKSAMLKIKDSMDVIVQAFNSGDLSPLDKAAELLTAAKMELSQGVLSKIEYLSKK